MHKNLNIGAFFGFPPPRPARLMKNIHSDIQFPASDAICINALLSI